MKALMVEALEDAVQDLVDASDDNTATMAALQTKVVSLTDTYVGLTRRIAVLTGAAVIAATLSAAATLMQAYVALHASPSAIVVQPVPVNVTVQAPAPPPATTPPRPVGATRKK